MHASARLLQRWYKKCLKMTSELQMGAYLCPQGIKLYTIADTHVYGRTVGYIGPNAAYLLPIHPHENTQ